MPLLRGHHLICLHFFSGEGYSKAFIENLGNVLRSAEDEEIEICSGPDDICRSCPYLIDNRCQYDKNADDDIKKMDKRALDLLGLAPDMPDIKVKWNTIREMIPGAFAAWHKAFCTDCDWKIACGKNELFRKLIEMNTGHSS